MNTKQIRLTTTASTRENSYTTISKKNTTPKTQIKNDVKHEEEVKRAI
jgi:hypothetical protein